MSKQNPSKQFPILLFLNYPKLIVFMSNLGMGDLIIVKSNVRDGDRV